MSYVESMRSFRSYRMQLLAVLVLCLLLPLPLVFAQGALDDSGLTPHQESELAYADALLKEHMPNYATLVLDKLDLPAEIMEIRRIRSLTGRGMFEEAQKIVDANTGTSQAAMTLRLALADGYYAWGRYAEAQALYEAFFKAFPQGPEASIKPFFMSSAYRYAQMMIMTGRRAAAAEAYRMALKAGPERHIQRQFQSELAELLMLMARDATGAERKKLIEEVQKVCYEILWIQDLWFGRAIVLLAHIQVLEGNLDAAMQLVDEYTPQLRAIDQALREQSEETGEDLTRLSPMAQCRYMIGEIMHDRAVQLIKEGGDRELASQLLVGRRTANGQTASGALQHFVNVFLRYPNTSWAPHAGNRFREVEALLKREFDREVNVRGVTPEQWAEVELAQFREARSLFNQSRYEDAVESYLDVLALFPESVTAIPAYAELSSSLIELERFTWAEAVARHLAERFGSHADLSVEAGNQVIRIAAKFLEVKRADLHADLYDVFFANFKRHPRTPLDLQRFAREAVAAGDLELAERYLTQIIKDFRDRPAYYDAMSSMARLLLDRGDKEGKVRLLDRLVKDLDEAGVRSHLRISAMYRLANALREMGPQYIDPAQARYRALRQLLESDQAAAFASNPDEVAANKNIHQAVMFFSAVADAMRTAVSQPVLDEFKRRNQGRDVPEQVILNNHYKMGAIRQLTELVDRFPDSVFGPPALSQIGTLYTFLQKSKEASEVLQRLQNAYPDSKEAKNAIFMIGLNLLEMGMRKEAVEYFKQMFAGGAQYPVSQVYTAAQTLLEAEEYQIALDAFDRVIASTEERRMLEPSRVGKGQALLGVGRYQDAVTHLDQVLEDYPQSALTITICRTASAASAALASIADAEESRRELFDRSVELMNRARRFATAQNNEVVVIELDLAVAGLSERRAEAEKRFGAAERVTHFKSEALAAYLTVIMFRDATNPLLVPHIQTAYARAIPLMLELERWEEAFEDAQGYLEKFPSGRYVSVMRQAITTARVRGGIAQ
jgi:tetratricopeptide (TPR) repeat protein